MFRFPPLTPFVRALLIGLIASFVLCAILENFVGVPIVALLALNPTILTPFTGLQLFTHTLVIPPTPGIVLSVILSLVFLWWCLAPLEERYGRTRAMQVCVVASLGAALPALLVGLTLPKFAGIVAGPGAITLAAIAAYVALLPPHAEMSIGRLGIQVRHILWLNIALSVAGFLTTRNAAQLGADLGAIGSGILFTRHILLRPPRRTSEPKRSGPSRLRLIKNDDDDEPKRWLN